MMAVPATFAFLALCVAPDSFSADPGWWSVQSVLSTNASSDYSPVLHGQAKHIAEAAQIEFDYMLEGDASPAITNLVGNFTTSNNFITLNLGQLKALAAPFYNQLDSLGYFYAYPVGVTNTYPWTSTPTDDSDYAAANLGQLKYIFSFDLDTDNDRMPDWWEWESFENLGQSGSGDTDGDGLTNLQEYQYNTNPNNADTEGDGMPDGWEIANGLDPISGLHTSLVGWWKFDDATGTTAVNSASTGYNGQLVNLATSSWVSGKLGGALHFNGSNSYVRISQSPVLITGQQFTASAWTYLDPTFTSTYSTIISDFDNCSYNYKGFWTGWDQFSGGGGAFLADCTGSFSKPSDATPITGAWHHIVVTHSGTTTRVYKDGVQIANTTGPFSPAHQSELSIGWANDPSDSYFWKGILDDVRLYTASLSSNQIAGIYDAIDDPDNDGLSNFVEYLLQTDPLTASLFEDDAGQIVNLMIYTPLERSR